MCVWDFEKQQQQQKSKKKNTFENSIVKNSLNCSFEVNRKLEHTQNIVR